MFGFGTGLAISGASLLNPLLGVDGGSLPWIHLMILIVQSAMVATIIGLFLSLLLRGKYHSVVSFFGVLLIGFGILYTPAQSYFKPQNTSKLVTASTNTKLENSVQPSGSLESKSIGKTNYKVIYKVQNGDTLWSIARSYYGRGSDWEKLIRLNTSRKLLTLGEQIEVPPLAF